MRLSYLSPLPWTSFAQRPHKFVQWFHNRTGGKVLWIDPYPTRLPKPSDFFAHKSKRDRVHSARPEWLTILQPRALPIEPLPGSSVLNTLLWHNLLEKIDAFVREDRCILGIGKPSKLALKLLARYPELLSFYDAMDDFPAFYTGLSRNTMKASEQRLVAGVSHLLTSSSAIATRLASGGNVVIPVLNACDSDLLPPTPQTGVSNQRPILGYLGTMGHWLDWPLVIKLAEINPDCVVRLIGPAFVTPKLPLPPNIELMPACDHSSAIAAMQAFDLGLIPFKRTELTASVDPIKYYEYRALGLPVLTTRFGEMALRERERGVFFMEAGNLAQQVRAALNFEDAEEEIQRFRRENSWTARFDAIGFFNL